MPYLVFLSVVLAVLPGAAWASPPTGQLLGHSLECVVDRGVSDFNIPTNPEVITALYFPDKLESGRRIKHTHRDFRITRDRNALYIRPRSDRPNAATNLVVKTNDSKMQVSLFVHRTDDPSKALRTCRFVHRDAVEAENARINAAVKVETAEIQTKLEEDQHSRIRRAQLAMLRKQLLERRKELLPVIREVTGNRGEVEIRLGHAIYFEGQFWTAFVIDNSRGWRPYRLAHVQTVDKSGMVSPIPEVHVDPPATHSDGNIAEIPAGARVEGFMMLPDVIQGRDIEAITFRGSSGPHTLVAAMQDPIWVWVPKREEEVERERRDRQALGVVSLYLQALGGFIWLKDGLGLDRSDATTITGGSVRATYGITSFLAVEAELAGAGTHEARFDRVELDGMQGDLARSAGLGRLQAGALVRLGYQTIPFLRIGVGLQGASLDSGFTVSGNEVPGPESAVAFDAFWYFGGGVERRLWEGFVAGVGLSVVKLAGSLMEGPTGTGGAIEVGAYLGYSWKP